MLQCLGRDLMPPFSIILIVVTLAGGFLFVIGVATLSLDLL